MSKLDELQKEYGSLGNRDFTGWQKDNFREGLKAITTKDVSSSDEGKSYIELLKKYRGGSEERIGGYVRNKRGGERGTNRGVCEEHAPHENPLFMRLSENAKNPKLTKTYQNVLTRIAARLRRRQRRGYNKATKRAAFFYRHRSNEYRRQSTTERGRNHEKGRVNLN